MIEALITPRSYRCASLLATPVVDAWLAHRRRKGKEDEQRFGERLGRPSLPRPEGRLAWMHAVSVGESLSLLPLIDRLRETLPDVGVLITSGTVTSARLLHERMPDGVCHQFTPVDRPGAVRRFARHWRPDLAVWVESELWPNLILETAARDVPMLLVNARMSDRSAARWRRMPHLSRPLLAAFAGVLAQTEADAARFRALGARNVAVHGNLKNDAAPLPANAQDVAALRRAIGSRPCWAAASTHEGEEEAVAEAVSSLRRTFPDLLTILAPRHPERSASIAELMERRGLVTARRSANGAIAPSTAIYLVDTLGELGLVYRLAEIAFVGGSLAPHGGHNPLEPARLDCALVAGPHTENFAEAYAALEDADAVGRVSDANALACAVRALLADESARSARSTAAHEAASSLGGAAEAALGLIRDHLEPCGRDARAGVLGV
ncbi:MAG: 3-deoxy-D-manno-octulosonic acid transferase [Rhodospirillaceae bacterium]|nr:3-deoxy-D-manno-octulosonic acid transferase [Rhodospirillaceae bacterium]